MMLFTLLQEIGSIEMPNTCSEGRSEIPVVKTDSSSLVVDQPHTVRDQRWILYDLGFTQSP